MKNTILSVLAFAGLSAGTTSAKLNDNCVPYVATDPFAVQMFSTLAKEHKGNFVFSPAGVEAVLKLLQQGARGTTAAELNALPMGKTGIKSAMNPAEADALFLADDFKLKAGIKADRIMRVPFATDATAAAKDINAWANENTRGLIPSVISAKDIDPRTRMVAANAIYLKEKWLHPFKKRATRENADFTMSDGTTTKVSMMYNKDKFHYAEGEDWQAVAMYYDNGEEGSNGEPGCFIGILPKGNVKEFACTLTPHKYQTIRTALANTDKERITALYAVAGKKKEKVTELVAGDIGCTVKLRAAKTNVTLCTPGSEIAYLDIKFPHYKYRCAVKAKDAKDEEKVSEAMAKIAAEEQGRDTFYP